jgi:carbonic anhydrase/acetyltransferase-like protein (isoleucine patch superfamily)/bifunctional DNA-binding transcriptional regulator/antitoxin component of YhaV-PrlF toxin-antitoxin module
MANGHGKVDAEGRLELPEGVRQALGWSPGDELLLQVHDGSLLVQRVTETATLKDEARRLAATMERFARTGMRQIADSLSTMAEPGKVTPPPAGQRPPAPPVAPVPPSPIRPAAPLTPAAAGAGIHAFGEAVPLLGSGAYLAPGSTVIGDVTLGEDVSVWPGTVVRGDVAAIRIGARTNLQDGSVVHVSPHHECVIGDGVTVGHQATVHAATVGNNSLIGIHAVVLDGARIGEHCIVAAGAVVSPGTEVPDGKMVMGVPGRVVRDVTAEEIERIHWHADSYVSLKNQYRKGAESPVVPAVTRSVEPAARTAPPQPGTLPRYECRRAKGAIAIDGALDDPGWERVPALSALVHADGGGAPTQPTEVRACWDDRALYVSFACKDTDIWGTFENRDDPLYDEEVVELFLCPTGNLEHYFEIEVSPLNVLFDATVFSPEGRRETMLVDPAWNAAGLRTAVRVSGSLNDRSSGDIGWTVELALPFTDLGLSGPPAPGTVWRANFYRIERGPATEFTAWSPTYKSPADFHVPACFGELVFLNG